MQTIRATPHQPLEVRIGGAAADHAVRAEHEQIADPRNGGGAG